MGVSEHHRSVAKAETELFVWPPRVDEGDIIVWPIDESRPDLTAPGSSEGCEPESAVSGQPPCGVDDPWGIENSTGGRAAPVEQDRHIVSTRPPEPAPSRIDDPWGLDNSTGDRSASVEQGRDIETSGHAGPRVAATTTLEPMIARALSGSSLPARERVGGGHHSGAWLLGIAVAIAMLFGTWSIGNRYQTPVRSPERAGLATAPLPAPAPNPAIAADTKHEPVAIHQMGNTKPAARATGNDRPAGIRSPEIAGAPPIVSISNLVTSGSALVTPPVTAITESREAETPTTVEPVRAAAPPSPRPSDVLAPASVEVPEVPPKPPIDGF